VRFISKLIIYKFSAVKFIFGAFLIFTIAGNFSNLASAQNHRIITETIFPLTNSSRSVNLTADTIKANSNTKFKMKKDPWKAVLYSAIIPGAGQFYNKSYWKIPIIAGVGGYFVYEIIKNNNKFLDYKDLYINSQTPENPQGDLRLKDLREFYSDQRDDFIIYSVILYVVNLIDAYVDAQLYDFDVSDKIRFGIVQKEKLIKLSYNF